MTLEERRTTETNYPGGTSVLACLGFPSPQDWDEMDFTEADKLRALDRIPGAVDEGIPRTRAYIDTRAVARSTERLAGGEGNSSPKACCPESGRIST